MALSLYNHIDTRLYTVITDDDKQSSNLYRQCRKQLIMNKNCITEGGLCQGKQGMITVSGETVLAPPVCCPWRNRASGIPPINVIGPIKAKLRVLVSLQLIETPTFNI